MSKNSKTSSNNSKSNLAKDQYEVLRKRQELTTNASFPKAITPSSTAISSPKKFVTLQKNKSAKQKVDKEITVDVLLKKLEKATVYTAYAKNTTLILLRIVRFMKGKAKSNQETTYLTLLTNKITAWSQYLSWIDGILQKLENFTKSTKMLSSPTQSQLSQLILMISRLNIALRAADALFTYVTLIKYISRKALSGLTFLFDPINLIITAAALYFFNTQMTELWPTIETATTELYNFLKETIFDNYEQWMEKLEEKNPELYDRVQINLQELEKWLSVPKSIISKGADIFTVTDKQRKKWQPVVDKHVLPVVDGLIGRSFDAFDASWKQLRKLYKGDPLSILTQDPNWANDFAQTIFRYFGVSSSPKKSKLATGGKPRPKL